MSDIVSFACSNSGFANMGGGVPWRPGAGATWIECPLGQAQGSAIAVWAVPGSTNPIAPGQALQGVRFTGQHTYITDIGGPLKTRVCTGYGGAGLGAGSVGTQALGTCVGTGDGVALDAYGYAPGTITSTDYNNDNLFIGVNAATDGADSFYGGLYYFEALNVTLYFGTTPPTDPHAPAGYFTNPIGNTNPGKIAGTQQFDAVKFTMNPPAYATTSTRTWTLRNRDGLLFANGTRTMSQVITPGYDSSCSKITIPAGLAPGSYPLTITITGITGNTVPDNLTQTTYLTVRKLGGMFMEA